MEETIFNENRKLKRQLDNLLRRARTNEQKQALFDSFGFEVISTNTPAQLRDYVLFQLQARFQLQNVVMTLIDFEYDAEKLFYGHDLDAKKLYESKLLLLDIEEDKEKIADLKSYPLLGEEIIQRYEWMLKGLHNIDQCNSAAILPLIRNNKLIGSIMLLSGDANRYQPGIATTFLQKLTTLIAVAIENCFNQQRIKEIGYQDPLTQAYNRRYFDLRFKDEIERTLRSNQDIACMFLDVDLFKSVNDTYGHHIGDLVLTRLVAVIKEQVRACDIVARYGGEEFVVVLPGVTLSGAVEIAERLRKSVEIDTSLSCGQSDLNITVSIGLQILSELKVNDLNTKEIAKALLQHSDQALYVAKESGRNKVVVYSGS